jgi:hypothetical protein
MTEKPTYTPIDTHAMVQVYANAITSMEEAENLIFSHYDPDFTWVDHARKKARMGMFVFKDNGHHRLAPLDYLLQNYITGKQR